MLATANNIQQYWSDFFHEFQLSTGSLCSLPVVYVIIEKCMNICMEQMKIKLYTVFVFNIRVELISKGAKVTCCSNIYMYLISLCYVCF